MKAQTSTFIIIAIVIVVVIGIGGYTYLENKRADEDRAFFNSLENKPTLDNIQLGIQNCLEVVAKDSLDTIGIQGGLYDKPLSSADYFDLEWAFIPYYYNQGEFLMPSQSKIENKEFIIINKNY